MAISVPSLIDDITGFVTERPLTSAAVGAGVVGAAIGTTLLVKSSKKRKAKTKRGRSRDRKFISREPWERKYKRKRKGKRYKTKKSRKARRGKVYYAKKTGQPYILLKSGKAKFIKGKRRKR